MVSGISLTGVLCQVPRWVVGKHQGGSLTQHNRGMLTEVPVPIAPVLASTYYVVVLSLLFVADCRRRPLRVQASKRVLYALALSKRKSPS